MSSLDYQSPEGQDKDSPLSDDSKLKQLKELLIGDEQSSINQIEARLTEVEQNNDVIAQLRAQLEALKSDSTTRAELAEQLERLKIDADVVSELLPTAVQKASQRDENLANSLSPTIASAFQESVRRDPESLADAVSPIMGPAIRRSISQAIAGMVQSMNQTMHHSFSPAGLKWRWEAFTTGKPFAEVVMLHSLIYLVEHVFLIRQEDGIVLSQVSSLPEDQTDGDMVSGMLTALQDFVRDSLGGQQTDALEDMRVGDRNIFVAHGPDAIVAAVIRGIPPESIRETMQEVSEQVHIKYARELDDFEGDTDVFIPAEFELRELLQSAYQGSEEKEEKPEPKSKWPARIKWGLAALVLLSAIAWLATLQRRRSIQRDYEQLLAVPESVDLKLHKGVLSLRGSAHDDWISASTTAAANLRHVDRVDTTELENIDQEWLNCLSALRAEPGIIVTEASRNGCVYEIEGLQDPLAKSAKSIIAECGAEPGQIRSRFSPFRSMESQFVISRTIQAVGEVDTVTWSQSDGRLQAAGEAPHEWCVRAEQLSKLENDIPIDVSQVVDIDRRALEESVAFVEHQTVMHQDGKTELADDQEQLIDEIAGEIAQLFRHAEAVGEPVSVIVVGHADMEERVNSPPQQLSERRARLVWQALTAREVSPELLLVRARGTGKVTAGETETGEDQDMRRCTFSVRLGL